MDEDGFVRQRRNVLVISFILLFAQGSTLTLTELNVLGNKASLQHPILVEPILWAAWIYLALRYWQAFNECGRTKFLQKFHEKYHSKLQKYALDHLSDIPPPTTPGDTGPVQFQGMSHLDPIDLGTWLTASCKVRFAYRTPDRGYEERYATLHIPISAILKARLHCFLHTTIATSVVTELYLPFLIAAIPVLVALYRGAGAN